MVSIAEPRASRTVKDTRAALVRVITFALARGLVARNVAASVRARGDVKTAHVAPATGSASVAVTAMRRQQERQEADRKPAEELGVWHDTGFVFSTAIGTALDAANVQRSFRAACQAAGIGESWTPRDLLHC